MEAALQPIVANPTPGALSSRDLLARKALSMIPAILSREDRNPHSPTCGCFDRDYWHHRSIDFPAGSTAEAVLPLALAWALPIPGSTYHRNADLAKCIEAGIRYSARSTHPDGSCDETAPFERCASAAAASLFGCLEAYRLLELHDVELLEFFTRRADWLARCKSRKLTPVALAMAALAFEKAGRLLDTQRWSEPQGNFVRRLLSMQDKEGWFAGPASANASSQTLALGLLAQLHCDGSSAELSEALTHGIEFISQIVRPDGSLPNDCCPTSNPEYFPHGFEIAGRWLPGALAVNDDLLNGLRSEPDTCCADFTTLVRRCWSFLLAWQDWVAERPRHSPRPAGRHYFKRAGLLIDRRDGCELHVSLKRGGIFALWRDGKPVIALSNFSVQSHKGASRITAVANHSGQHDVHLDGHSIVIRGKLRLTDQSRMCTSRLVLRRLYMCSLGRFFARSRAPQDCTAASAGPSTPYRFARTLLWENGRLHVKDELHSRRGWSAVCAAAIAASPGDRTRPGTFAQLQQWTDLTQRLHELADDEPLHVERVL